MRRWVLEVSHVCTVGLVARELRWRGCEVEWTTALGWGDRDLIPNCLVAPSQLCPVQIQESLKSYRGFKGNLGAGRAPRRELEGRSSFGSLSFLVLCIWWRVQSPLHTWPAAHPPAQPVQQLKAVLHVCRVPLVPPEKAGYCLKPICSVTFQLHFLSL